MLPAARDLFDVWRPEMVVREPCEYATAVLAHGAGVAQLQIGVSQSAIELRSAGNGRRHDRAPGRWGCCGDHGRPVPDLVSGVADPSPWPDTRRFRLQSPASGPLPDWWPGDRRPLVYVTFGTVLGHLPESRAVYRTALDAVADLPARVLMTVGRAVDPAALVLVPSNTHVERWVSQGDVFREARLVVCHGGSGTTFGALAAGLPIVICPLFADQTANARLVQKAGAGLAVSTSEDAAGGLGSLRLRRCRCPPRRDRLRPRRAYIRANGRSARQRDRGRLDARGNPRAALSGEPGRLTTRGSPLHCPHCRPGGRRADRSCFGRREPEGGALLPVTAPAACLVLSSGTGTKSRPCLGPRMGRGAFGDEQVV